MAENVPPAASKSEARTPTMRTAVMPKMSFASVAALPPRRPQKSPALPKGASAAPPGPPQIKKSAPVAQQSPRSRSAMDITQSLAQVAIDEPIDSSPPRSKSDAHERASNKSRLDDDRTHLSVSSTKATSLDEKSTVSTNALALDEKESLRPDDSASLQAVDDDDVNSHPESGEPASRTGSDSEARAFQSQLHEISERASLNGVGRAPSSAHRGMVDVSNIVKRNGLSGSIPPATPQLASSGPANSMVDSNGLTQGLDDKLVQALESPRDRVFLLQLEQTFISFIRNPREHTLDLPPSNSFCRLLAHRLGDYYQLPHFVETSSQSVRLYKSTASYLPTPLHSLARPQIVSEDLGPAQPSMKIMRRQGATASSHPSDSAPNTTTSSARVSRPGSDAGDEGAQVSGLISPAESTTTKDRAAQSREEREAKYKQVRERIFGDFRGSEADEGGNGQSNSAEPSRPSSASGRRRKKPPRRDDDGFQARSAYNAYQPRSARSDMMYGPIPDAAMGYYSHAPHMQQPNMFGVSLPASYHSSEANPYFSGQIGTQHPMGGPTGFYGPQIQPQAPMAYPHGLSPPIPGHYPPSQPASISMMAPSGLPSSPAMSHAAPASGPQAGNLPEGQWSQNGFQPPYPNYPAMPGSYIAAPYATNGSMPNGVPYAFGQLPFPAEVQGNRGMHPIPGSYHRLGLESQTQTFLSSGEAGTSFPSDYGGGRPGMVPDMMLAGPANAHNGGMGPATSTPPRRTFQQQGTQSNSPGRSTLSKWGTPASLPPKPPPPAALHFTGSSNGVPPPGVPTFHNGTYSSASVSH